MAVNKECTEKIIKEFGRNDKDTGSPEVQIALLTERINYLTEHFKVHKKDFCSRRGLMIMIGQRRRFLDYLKSIDKDKYLSLIKKLKLRK